MVTRRRRTPPSAPHPLQNAFWTPERGWPDLDEPRCEGCGGCLSFEFHDGWHELKVWNDMVFADGELERQTAFEKRLKDEAKIQATRERAQGAEPPAPWDLF